jgi:phosphate transport system substrate-binding protein
MSAIAEEFQEDHSDVNINVSQTGTGSGFSNHFCTGNTDFNNASRRITDSEGQLCSDNGVEYIELRAATDALTVIVSNDNTFVDCLTTDELAQIWRADAAQSWQEVREEWPDEPIERYGPADTSGTYDYFIEHVQGSEAGHTDDYQATEQDNTIVQGVQGNQYGIGYFGFAYFYQNPDEVQAVPIHNGDRCVEPSLETASANEYTPLSRPLFTYCSKQSLSEEHIAEFSRFFLEQSTNEDLVAGDVGYVPNSEETKEEQLDLLNEAISSAQS